MSEKLVNFICVRDTPKVEDVYTSMKQSSSVHSEAR